MEIIFCRQGCICIVVVTDFALLDVKQMPAYPLSAQPKNIAVDLVIASAPCLKVQVCFDAALLHFHLVHIYRSTGLKCAPYE